MPRNRSIKKKNTGALFVIAGLLLIIISLVIKYQSSRVLSFSGIVNSPQAVKSGSVPVEIAIDSVGINLAVTEGIIENGVWQISETGATHLNTSANPGGGGNIVIYAHNKSNLFGRLPKVKKGDLVILRNERKERLRYVVEETVVVTPSEIGYVLPKTIETLTLYTCVGFMDRKRAVVIAMPVN